MNGESAERVPYAQRSFSGANFIFHVRKHLSAIRCGLGNFVLEALSQDVLSGPKDPAFDQCGNATGAGKRDDECKDLWPCPVPQRMVPAKLSSRRRQARFSHRLAVRHQCRLFIAAGNYLVLGRPRTCDSSAPSSISREHFACND